MPTRAYTQSARMTMRAHTQSQGVREAKRTRGLGQSAGGTWTLIAAHIDQAGGHTRRASGLRSIPHQQPALRLLPLLPQIVLDASMDLEAEQPRHIRREHHLRHQVLVCEEEQVREGRAEIGAVQGFELRRARAEDFPASWAEDLGGALSQQVAQSDGQHRLLQSLALAQRADAVDEALVFVQHRGHPPTRQNEACMDEPV
mmetsp:Transcript_23729/g.54913  ORF Transcript_23729/g.54913 Transcript_23729/m.54913 type:complete len:201 (+) Transcript_23729:31-633(+)